jgi:hypothetical protein
MVTTNPQPLRAVLEEAGVEVIPDYVEGHGISIRKVENTPANLGKSAELAFAEVLCKHLRLEATAESVRRNESWDKSVYGEEGEFGFAGLPPPTPWQTIKWWLHSTSVEPVKWCFEKWPVQSFIVTALIGFAIGVIVEASSYP